MRVRPARPGDAEALRTAVSRASETRVFEAETDPLVADFSVAGVREAAASADCCYLAERDGKPVGIALAHPDPDGVEAELLALWVHPDYCGDGVEERLLERIAADLEKQGVRQLRATVDAGDETGEEYYLSQGFTTRGTRLGDGCHTDRETVVVATIESLL